MARRPSDSPPSSKRANVKAAPPTADASVVTVPAGPDFLLESEQLAAGARLVAGIDEAGRGPLAGPVVAAAVILDPSCIPDGLDDSKKLTAEERERLFEAIVSCATVAAASASAAEIDRYNIRGATLLAMRRALHALGERPCHTLIDGRDVPTGLQCRATAVIAGDARCLSIAAASIVAKVTRDRMMRRACGVYSGYGFSRHMGYATAEHRDAILRLGPSPLHRMSFRPLKPDLLLAAE
ncbi:ribonuclease HII [Mangrovicella endophytica]|uniref:ribonuclease HII n=1 Tax=Mangrovicella endophytica TaxID=2066697 RepID=UPI000C9E7C00